MLDRNAGRGYDSGREVLRTVLRKGCGYDKTGVYL